MKDLAVLRRTAAEITAAAVFEMFPDIEIGDRKETAAGFSCEFRFPHPVHPDTLPLIEERIRQIVKEKRPVRTLEMVAFSAQELFKSQGRRVEAEALEAVEGLVELIQIGSFLSLSHGPHLKNTAELAAFKLLGIEILEEKRIRISGACADSKQDLKDFLKKWDLYSVQNHVSVGEREKLWTLIQNDLIWLQPGLKLKNATIQFLKNNLFDSSFEIAGPLEIEGDRTSLHGSLAKELGFFPARIGEIWTSSSEFSEGEAGLFDSREESLVQISSFCAAEGVEQSLISSLQSIAKMITILGFNYSLKLIGRRKSEKGFLGFQNAPEKLLENLGKAPQIEFGGKSIEIQFLVEDGLGREWPVVKVGPVSSKEKAQAGFFIAASVEKIIALLLERYLLKMNLEELMNMMVRH